MKVPCISNHSVSLGSHPGSSLRNQSVLEEAGMCRCAPCHPVLQQLPDPPEHISRAGVGGTAFVLSTWVPSSALPGQPFMLHSCKKAGWYEMPPTGLWWPSWLAKDVNVPQMWDWPTPKCSRETSMLSYLKIQILKEVKNTCHSNMISQKCCHPNAPS